MRKSKKHIKTYRSQQYEQSTSITASVFSPLPSFFNNNYSRLSQNDNRIQQNNILMDIISDPTQDYHFSFHEQPDEYNSDTTSQHYSIVEEDICYQLSDTERTEQCVNYAALDELIDEEKDSEILRITYYSPVEQSTIHARKLSEIPLNGQKLSDMFKNRFFWVDILQPTDNEMKVLSKIFHIHPLTIEDIRMEEIREKCEVFKNYYFICFRSFEENQISINYLQSLGIYILVFKEGILTFHYKTTLHPLNVRKRIKQLKNFLTITSDWIAYALLDDITDSFAPLIYLIEFEVDSIDDLVLILKQAEQSDMLRRIGYCRKKMMTLLRLLGPKSDVINTLIKRIEGGIRPKIGHEIKLYLGDVHDHLITMLQSLNHCEKISSRSHSNYLAQISIEITQTNNEINDILSKLTALGSILIPMNLITGLWGMNVLVPGQNVNNLSWFICIASGILTFCIISGVLMRIYRII